MTSHPRPNPPTHVIPQVGAILHLDTALGYPAVELGNKHWALDGSCVLVAPDRILTVRHTLGKTGQAAAFFPYEGIIPIENERVEDYDYGDSMCLCRLKWAVRFASPVRYEYISRSDVDAALVAGFGKWDKVESAEDGIQRSIEVKLHMPGKDRYEKHGDYLDVCWWSPWNGGLKAERNNSGGAVLLDEISGHTLLGLSRETKEDQQAASRITRDRREWLDKELNPVPCRPLDRAMTREAARVFSVGHDRCVTEPFDVPQGATKVHLTLSATPGLRLQMGIAEPGEEEWVCGRLRRNDENCGRFLYRCERLLTQASKLVVVVAPVASGPARVESVDAQICCMFT